MQSRLLILNAIILVLGYSILLQPDTWSVEACGPGRTGYRRGRLRRLVPLIQRESVPDVSENTQGASGRAEGAIKRNTKRFKDLVQNWNPDIEFRDDERTGADRMMTQRLKEKLSILAISVMNQWPHVRLRVIEGWDEDGKHSANSLHYEGRAVDITTSDRDRSKYGLLARLAVEAGFDWVHYESRSHVHCSVKSERADIIRNNGCFDGASLVETPEGSMQISQLQTNDLVLAMNPQTGQLQFSPVIMWLDRDQSGRELYVELRTSSNKLIRLTSSHLIYVADEASDLSLLSSTSAPPKLNPLPTRPESGRLSGSDDDALSSPQYTLSGELEPQGSVKAANSNATQSHTTVPKPTGCESTRTPAQFLFEQAARFSIDDFAYTTYARNAIVGQYLLVNPTEEKQQKSTTVDQSAASKLHYDFLESTERPLTRLVFASGDVQRAERGQKALLSPSTVKFDQIVSVNYITRKGIHAPLTREGNIVVNSVVASCYAMISDHELAHIALAPVRWFSYLNEWVFGLETSSPTRIRILNSAQQRRQLDTQLEDDSSTNDYPHPQVQPYSSRVIHWYPMLLYRIAKFILPTRYLY